MLKITHIKAVTTDGTTLESAIKDAISRLQTHAQFATLEFDFNGISIRVNGGSDWTKIEAAYQERMKAKAAPVGP
jgi:hypothetical protein